ncbi:hypothetical protein AWC25_09295 [Mycobacterium sherrisii]|nr:hypothetical protein AWC25_09295 [Mycobacterium sherrisii]
MSDRQFRTSSGVLIAAARFERPAWRVIGAKDVYTPQRKGPAVKSTAKAAVRRIRQARTALVRVELTWAAIQFLAAAALIGGVVSVALWARRRQRHQRHTGQPQPNPDVQEKAAANGLAN